ncbi:hypothetical protein, partial [Pectobacterium odoriferum]|uniref:hypothetical protein n=1 Tax=Pectobacterium odoriferum TaxID=78398 RepID=UPI001CA4916B
LSGHRDYPVLVVLFSALNPLKQEAFQAAFSATLTRPQPEHPDAHFCPQTRYRHAVTSLSACATS